MVTEIYCYCHLDDKRTKLTSELNRISDAIASVCDQLEGCRFRMEGGQLPLLLCHLEDQVSFTPSVANIQQRRRNTRRLHVDGGASP